ncbi:MAG: hypothetical protein V1706_03360 [Pseudomonadota bacterium]
MKMLQAISSREMYSFFCVGVLGLFLLIGCKDMGEQVGMSKSSISDISSHQWDRLSEQNIYFGHQSVGSNILDGIKQLMKDNPHIKLNILETSNSEDFGTGVFAHARIGKNKVPNSKISAFANSLENGVADKCDIVFMKFCYVDIDSSSDVEKIFFDYKEMFVSLKKKYPEVQFVHMTMPVTTVQTGPKAWIKKILGKPVGGENENVMRSQYNTLLDKQYKGREPIFDIATVEATEKNGHLKTFSHKGKEYLQLAPEYTDDGGHLNNNGRRIVAEKLLVFLVDLVERQEFSVK